MMPELFTFFGLTPNLLTLFGLRTIHWRLKARSQIIATNLPLSKKLSVYSAKAFRTKNFSLLRSTKLTETQAGKAHQHSFLLQQTVIFNLPPRYWRTVMSSHKTSFSSLQTNRSNPLQRSQIYQQQNRQKFYPNNFGWTTQSQYDHAELIRREVWNRNFPNFFPMPFASLKV